MNIEKNINKNWRKSQLKIVLKIELKINIYICINFDNKTSNVAHFLHFPHLHPFVNFDTFTLEYQKQIWTNEGTLKQF